MFRINIFICDILIVLLDNMVRFVCFGEVRVFFLVLFLVVIYSCGIGLFVFSVKKLGEVFCKG